MDDCSLVGSSDPNNILDSNNISIPYELSVVRSIGTAALHKGDGLLSSWETATDDAKILPHSSLSQSHPSRKRVTQSRHKIQSGEECVRNTENSDEHARKVPSLTAFVSRRLFLPPIPSVLTVRQRSSARYRSQTTPGSLSSTPESRLETKMGPPADVDTDTTSIPESRQHERSTPRQESRSSRANRKVQHTLGLEMEVKKLIGSSKPVPHPGTSLSNQDSNFDPLLLLTQHNGDTGLEEMIIERLKGRLRNTNTAPIIDSPCQAAQLPIPNTTSGRGSKRAKQPLRMPHCGLADGQNKPRLEDLISLSNGFLLPRKSAAVSSIIMAPGPTAIQPDHQDSHPTTNLSFDIQYQEAKSQKHDRSLKKLETILQLDLYASSNPSFVDLKYQVKQLKRTAMKSDKKMTWHNIIE